MSGDYGLEFFPPDNTRENEALYDSRKPRINIDLTATPKRMDIVNIRGGTALAVGTVGTRYREVLLPIAHNLGYTPECFVYFYVRKYNGLTTAPQADNYSGDILSYSSFIVTTANDAIFYEVDNKELRIVHEIVDFVTTGVVSDADKYELRVKYYISSNDSHTTGISYEEYV